MFLLNVFLYIWIFGTLFLPYIIGIILSGVIILIIRKKIIEKDKGTKILIYIIIMISCVFVSRSLGYPIMNYFSAKPDKVYIEAKKLNDNNTLIGLSKEEVVGLLGEPLSSTDTMYVYSAGKKTDYIFLGEREFYKLFVFFDEYDRVKSTKIDLPLGG